MRALSLATYFIFRVSCFIFRASCAFRGYFPGNRRSAGISLPLEASRRLAGISLPLEVSRRSAGTFHATAPRGYWSQKSVLNTQFLLENCPKRVPDAISAFQYPVFVKSLGIEGQNPPAIPARVAFSTNTRASSKMAISHKKAGRTSNDTIETLKVSVLRFSLFSG